LHRQQGLVFGLSRQHDNSEIRVKFVELNQIDSTKKTQFIIEKKEKTSGVFKFLP
jgi:hypothetical protein